MKTRRTLLGWIGRLGLAGAATPLLPPEAARAQPAPDAPASEHFDLVVIGTGFGGTMTALTTAYALDRKRPPGAPPIRILMLERGTWWTTPMETVQDKTVATRDFLLWKNQPTQEWSSVSDARGMIDLLRRCRHSDKRPQGLYDFAPVGQRGLLFRRNDGVSVLRASGVGGGSLVYSKISIRPPETLFDDPRWPGAWQGAAGAGLRRDYFQRAMESIHRGIEWRFTRDDATAVATGASNIVTRSARLEPAVEQVTDALVPSTDGRPLMRIAIAPGAPLKPRERELIDRARVFQTAMAQLTPHYGTVELAINDVAPEPGARQSGKNYCERHGRCNVGCLPGAGQTLNKQIFRAIWGSPGDAFDKAQPRESGCVLKGVAIELRALAEVDHVGEREGGGYVLRYRQRYAVDPTLSPKPVAITADRVVVAAGTLGTAEILLRSKARPVEGLAGLSDQLGRGFSPNGDHIALLYGTKERINLNAGPVTTSFGWFDPQAPRAEGFVNVEDQGIPRALSSLAHHGREVLLLLAERSGGIDRLVKMAVAGLDAVNKVFSWTPERSTPRQGDADLSADRPENEDELGAHTMCIVAQGTDRANGRFSLEDGILRVKREDGLAFHQDPIYSRMREKLQALADKLMPPGQAGRFVSPLVDAVLPGQKPVVLTSHPLGGCPMAASPAEGVVDEHGRAFRTGAAASLYAGLYVADGSVIPSALGVNPSLTIAAVALRTADTIIDEWDRIPSRAPRVEPARECTA